MPQLHRQVFTLFFVLLRPCARNLCLKTNILKPWCCFTDDETVTEPGVSTYIPALKFLVWPSIPASIKDRVEATTSLSDPVLVNPNPEAPAQSGVSAPAKAVANKTAAALQAIRQCGPSPLDPAVPLDETIAQTAHCSAWQGSSRSAPGQAVTMHTRLVKRQERRRIRAMCSTDREAGSWVRAKVATASGTAAAQADAAHGAVATVDEEDADTEEEAEELPPLAERFAQAYIDQVRILYSNDVLCSCVFSAQIWDFSA